MISNSTAAINFKTIVSPPLPLSQAPHLYAKHREKRIAERRRIYKIIAQIHQ